MIFELPPVLSGSERAQLSALRDYLVRMALSLRSSTQLSEAKTLALEKKSESEKLDSERRVKAGEESLKALIKNTAHTIERSVEQLSAALTSDYLALSDFGTYTESTEGRFSAQAERIEEAFTRTSEVSTAFENYRSLLEGDIRRGVIEDPETGEDVIGIAISQQLYFEENGVPYVDREGGIWERLYSGQSFALYTSRGWQSWINGVKAGSFEASDSALHLIRAELSEGMKIGSNWLISTRDGGLGIRYIG